MNKYEKAGLTTCKVAELLLSGKNVNTEDFRSVLGESHYRLSTYMWRIRKFLGGDVIAIRDGKTVTGYRLINSDMFKDFALPVKEAKVKVTKAPKAAKVKAPKVKPAKAPTKVVAKAATKKPAKLSKVEEDLGEVTPLSAVSVDADFDSVDPMDIPSFLK